MSEKIMIALISGGGAFLGALIAFVGVWVTNRRTLDVTREQRRYDLVRDKRGEIIPQMCYKTRELLREFEVFVNEPIEMRDQEGNISMNVIAENVEAENYKVGQLLQRARDLSEYHKLNAVWLPTRLAKPIDELLVGYIEEAQRFINSIPKNKRSADLLVQATVASKKVDEMAARVEANAAEIEPILARYGPSSREIEEDPQVAAASKEMREVKAYVDASKAEVEAVAADLGIQTQPEIGESRTETKEESDEDRFLDTFLPYHEVAKGQVRMWLTWAKLHWQFSIYQESRKVLGVDDGA